MRQLLHQVHRPVLATGAADGHGDVAAVVPHQSGQPLIQERLDVLLHLADFGV